MAKLLHQAPVSQREIDRYDRHERNIINSMAITGKTREEIIAFVTGSPISYSDLGDFVLITGRLPDLKEQNIIFTHGVEVFQVRQPALTVDQLRTLRTNLNV